MYFRQTILSHSINTNENNHSRVLTVFVIAGVCVFKNSASIHCRGSELWRDTRDCDQTVSGRVFNGLKPVTVFCDHAQCSDQKLLSVGS